jgi:hypothetical protein
VVKGLATSLGFYSLSIKMHRGFVEMRIYVQSNKDFNCAIGRAIIVSNNTVD